MSAQPPKQSPSSYLAPAPREPVPLNIQNIGLEVRPNENVAYGWTVWAARDDGYEPPAFTAGDLDGKRVQRITSSTRYDAALLQSARVQPGLAVQLQMKFRVTPDSPVPPGTRPKGFVVGVGIDPTGGNDVRSDNVQWALRDLRYSQTVTAAVMAVARNETVTAFVRTIAFIPGSGADVGDGSGQTCAHLCQIHFSRTYLLLPTNATRQQWINAAGIAFDQGRWTMGGSADDAGLGSALLGSAPVVQAVNYPASWGADFGQQWFVTNYPPGVNFRADFHV